MGAGSRLFPSTLLPVVAPSAQMGAGASATPSAASIVINATIVSDDPEIIWKKLERYARLKSKSGFRLGR
jgi:hypothetical protein